MEWKNLQSWLNNFKNLDQDQRDKIDKIKLVRINSIWSAILSLLYINTHRQNLWPNI